MLQDDFLLAIAASRKRTLSVPVDASAPAGASVQFDVRLPSEHAAHIAGLVSVDTHPASWRAAYADLRRRLLESAITGWRGVQMRHLLASADETELAFAEGLVSTLLDARDDWDQALCNQLDSAIIDARTIEEAARKNLPA